MCIPWIPDSISITSPLSPGHGYHCRYHHGYPHGVSPHPAPSPPLVRPIVHQQLTQGSAFQILAMKSLWGVSAEGCWSWIPKQGFFPLQRPLLKCKVQTMKMKSNKKREIWALNASQGQALNPLLTATQPTLVLLKRIWPQVRNWTKCVFCLQWTNRLF